MPQSPIPLRVCSPHRALLWLLVGLSVACGVDEPAGNAPADDLLAQMVSGAPAGWGGGTSRPSDWDMGLDQRGPHSGSASAYLRSRVPQPAPNAFVVLAQQIRADDFRGKRVRFSGFVRTHQVSADGAALWFRGDGPPGSTAFDNMDTRMILGTRDWTRFEIVLDIPAKVIGLAYGLYLAGPGIAWVDDIRMEVVGIDVPVTAGPRDGTQGVDSTALAAQYNRYATAGANFDFEGLRGPEDNLAVVDWVKSNTSVLSSDDPGAPLSDLTPLRDIVGSAPLVALGEATHGTREFFRMKHRVFRYLVETLGFTHFAIEASFPEALAVDRYVQTGQGDPATLIKGMFFWTWSTEEVLDLVRWMREWNAAGKEPRVRFVGFDMQYPGAGIDSVVSFVQRMEPSDAIDVRAKYSCLDNYRNTATRQPRSDLYLALAADVRAACSAAVAAVDSLLANRAPRWRATVGKDAMDLAQRYARLVVQWEAAQITPPFNFYARDEFMAENAAWWLENAPVGSRVMLWAHNGHIWRVARAMGSHLASRYTTNYVPIVLTFSSGSFTAVTQSGGQFGRLTQHVLVGAEIGSLEALFTRTGAERLLFDARRVLRPGAPRGEIGRSWLRSIGSTFDPSISTSVYRTIVVLPDDFDAVIWFNQGSASRLLP